MTMTRSAKLFTGLGLMAGLFWGCQDLVSHKDGPAKEPDSMASDASALRLSIKDDSACREQWNAILDARTGGLADTAAEKSFLANCVKEIKPGKDTLPPVIPPHLQPDSISRCRWIVAQIDKGRKEMTISYKRYCPGDCRNLEDKDSTRHVRFCRDPHGPGVDTTKPRPVDSCRIYRERLAIVDSNSAEAVTLRRNVLNRCGQPPIPPIDTTKPRPVDSCRIYRERLASLDSNSSQAANLRQYLLFRCGNPPIDTTNPQPPGDTCKFYLARLAGLDTASAEYKSLRMFLQLRCGQPPIDTVRPPDPMEDTCNMIRARLAELDSASEEAAKWRRILLERCGRPPIDTTRPPEDTIVKPPLPQDTLPKPIPLTPARSCDKLRATLLKLNPASADYKLLVDAILAHCTEAKP